MILVAAQNNAIMSDCTEAKIDKTQLKLQVLFGDRDERMNHVISEYSQLVYDKYKKSGGWVEVIHRELCKELKFDHTNKWYIYKQESFLENETHKFLFGFEKQIDYQILARRPDLVYKKENLPWSEIFRFGRPQWKIKENEKSDYLNLVRELKSYRNGC